MRKVTLYGKPECSLCEAARAALLRVRDRQPFALEEIDITTDPELHKRFLVRIPVIALEGEELYDYDVDEADLSARLAREPSPGRRG